MKKVRFILGSKPETRRNGKRRPSLKSGRKREAVGFISHLPFCAQWHSLYALGIMEQESPKTCPSRSWLDRLLHWSNFWFHIGLWIWAGSLWLLKWWFPVAFHPVELFGGILTGMAAFYLMHYFIIVSNSRIFRWICIPLVGLIDILTISGIIALIFNLGKEQ
jgi:hypothetical protein